MVILKMEGEGMKHKCEHCGKEKENLKKEDGWQMQYLYFSDADIEYLTCEDCKNASPMEYLEKLESRNGVAH